MLLKLGCFINLVYAAKLSVLGRTRHREVVYLFNFVAYNFYSKLNIIQLKIPYIYFFFPYIHNNIVVHSISACLPSGR